MRKLILVSTALLAGMIWSAAVQAEEWTAGQIEFNNACAACHGVSADGHGPITDLLKDPAADLTMLKQKNGGVFPFDLVFRTVDGRNDMRAHGSDMPVWGDRFKAETADQGGPASEINTLGRIAAIVYYLDSLQK